MRTDQNLQKMTQMMRGHARGIIAIGGYAFGLLALGGAAIGGLAIGAGTLVIVALGSGAIGYYACCGAFGVHVLSGMMQDLEMLELLKRLMPGTDHTWKMKQSNNRLER